MSKVQTNFISLLLGCLFSYLSVWFSGIGAAAPVPEFLTENKAFPLFFYANMIIVLAAGIFAFLVLLIVRKLFTLFTQQNLLCFAMPIILFVSSMLIFMGVVVAPLLYAALATLSVAALITQHKNNC